MARSKGLPVRVQRFVDVATARHRCPPFGLLEPLPALCGLGRQRHARRRRAAPRRFQRVRAAAEGHRRSPVADLHARGGAGSRALAGPFTDAHAGALSPPHPPTVAAAGSGARAAAAAPAGARPGVSAPPAAPAAVYALTNELRAENGLPPLAINSALDMAADRYGATLAANDWFAHEGPDGSTLRSRAEAAGYSGWGYLLGNPFPGGQ